ncbi:protein inturned-like isoform X1 [Haliotis rufescens]|uniref:protein inturned-like isoform X1 n=1 Tax=Haliotis rufescens TaxID=6454 RepID=UPI00201F55BF|nr:protein inturned-like isoform X1 [Haliotis rufescens]
MAYFPSIGPFYDPENEQEIYDGSDGRLKTRQYPRAERQNVISHPGNENLSARISPRDNGGSDKVGASWTPYVNQKQGDVYYVDVEKPSRTDKVTNDSYPYFQRFAPESVNQHNGHGNPDIPKGDVDSLQKHCDRGSISSQDRALSERGKLSQRNQRNEDVHRNEEVTDFRHFGKDADERKMWKDENFNDRTSGSSHGSGSHFVRHGSMDSFEEYRDMSESVQSRKSYDVERWKDVVLVPDFRTVRRDDGGVLLCEKLFGVILFQFNHKPGSGRSRNSESREVLKDRKVIVQGVAPRTAAERSGKIHRGDMLISVNDNEVTWLNIDKLFQVIQPKKNVKLTLQSPVIVGPKPPVHPRPRFPRHDIYRRVTGHSVKEGQKNLSASTYTLLYLTLTESSEDSSSTMDEVVYMYPPENNKLIGIRGLFLTINSSLVDVTNFKAKNSSVQHQSEVIHLAYSSENKDVLVLGLPADRVPLALLNQLMEDIVKLLKFMFGGLGRAFRDCDKEQLDQLFALTFHQLLTPRPAHLSPVSDLPSSSKLLSSLSAVRSLHLAQDQELICDEILSEFEAADFDEFMEEEELDNRRAYTILGSSLFYKCYQLCSHLPSADSSDLHLFLRHQSLLHLLSLQSVDEIVVWQEVWPTYHHPGTHGYPTPKGRCFLLVVGMKHFLLGCLLEMGGCTQWGAGKMAPHPLYVDQAKATLLQLETDDVTMAEWCEERILSDAGSVSLVGAERYLARSKISREETILMSPVKPMGSPKSAPSPLKSSVDGVFKYRSSPLADRKPGSEGDPDRSPSTEHSTPVMTRQGSKLSYGSNDSGGSGSSTGAPRSKSSRKSFQNDMSSISKSLSALQVEELPIHGGHAKITRGGENVLFHYVQLHDLEGVYVTPSDYELASVQGAIHSQLLDNFYRCSLHIRKLFTEQKQVQAFAPLRPRFGVGSTLVDLEEHGVMFRHAYPTSPEARKNTTVLCYWVVGRRFPLPDQRELYVCFHESVTQSLVEVAFNLGFGVLGVT